jgi:hypothetical protein
VKTARASGCARPLEVSSLQSWVNH